MNDQDIRIKQLEEALTRLAEFRPETKDELDQWYEEAGRLQEGDLLKDVPHFLRHYLSDADIRMKDEDYAKMQNGHLNLLLEHLKRGVMPSDEDLGMTYSGVWSWITRWFRR